MAISSHETLTSPIVTEEGYVLVIVRESIPLILPTYL